MPQAKQVLGYVEEKLRRVFNLAGPIGVTLEPEVKPVIIVDDLRDPGHAFYQGRGFAWGNATQPTGGVGVWACIQVVARDDFVTELLWHSMVIPANSTFAIQVLGPDDVPLTSLSSSFQAGSWRDRKNGQNDYPPVLINSVNPQPAAVIPNSTIYVAGSGGTARDIQEVLPLKIFVQRGGALLYCWQAWGAAVATAANVGFAARVFPQ